MASTSLGRENAPVTPMMEQYRRLKEENPDALLFFRLGDFYELFCEDAQRAAPILDVQLTSRDGQVPMCGVPHHALMVYVQKIMNAGLCVALAEQMEDPRQAKGLVERQVVRRFSPGTFIAEDSTTAPRFGVLYRDARGWALAVAELASGLLFVTEATGFRTDQVVEEWRRWQPDEYLSNWSSPVELPGQAIEGDQWFEGLKSSVKLERELAAHLGTATLSGWGLDSVPRAQRALAVLVRYLDFSQKRQIRHWSAVHVLDPSAGMRLSPHALASLDVFSADGGPDLYRVLNRTRTPMGARLLKRWLDRPLVDLDAIRQRSARVQRWQGAPLALAQAAEQLDRIGDLDRRISRLSLGLGFPRDLLALRTGLEAYHHLCQVAEQAGEWLPPIDHQVVALQEALATLDDEPPARWEEGGMFRPGVDEELDSARTLTRDHRQALAELEQAERERSGIRSLKVGYHRAFGYYLEVSRAQSDQVPADWRRRQTMTKTERYTSDRLLALESDIVAAEEHAHAIEAARCEAILGQVSDAAGELNRLAGALAELDVLACLARVASERGYVWPEWTDGSRAPSFQALRHPVLETVIDHYVPTDFLPDDGKRMMIVTGPNMGGKSTFMRAVALAVFLGHIGMAVPARWARLPVMDGIYTRIGADDHLFRGQSTFMAELEEVAYILRKTSDQSLVLLDELGRGTSTYDGLAIASAVVDYLAQAPGPFTLFATHYHELTELIHRRPSVENWTVEVVSQDDGQLVFSHRVVPGNSNRSYGLEVARLAGLPRVVLDRARAALHRYEVSGAGTPATVEQLSLMQPPNPLAEALLQAVANLDPDEITPRAAWEWLAEWHARVENKREV